MVVFLNDINSLYRLISLRNKIRRFGCRGYRGLAPDGRCSSRVGQYLVMAVNRACRNQGKPSSIGACSSVGLQAGAVRARPALIAYVKRFLVALENMYSFVMSSSDIIRLRNNPHRRIYG